MDSSTEPLQPVYLRLTYPLSHNKYVTVGLFEHYDYDVCVSFTNGARRMVIDVADWNLLNLFRDRITDGLQRSHDLTFTYETAADDEKESPRCKPSASDGHKYA